MPEPNVQIHSQTCSSAYLGRLHAFVAKKSTRVSLPGNSAFGCRNAPVLHHFSCRNRMPKKHSQTCSSAYLGRLHAFVAKKSTRVSLPGNSAFRCRNAPVLHHFSCRNRMPKKTPKHVLGSN